MNIEKKKASDKKLLDTNLSQIGSNQTAITSTSGVSKLKSTTSSRRTIVSKFSNEKEIKLDETETLQDENSIKTISINLSASSSTTSKQSGTNIKKKIGETSSSNYSSISNININSSSTPKSSTKISDKNFNKISTSNSISVNTFSTNISNIKGPLSQSQSQSQGLSLQNKTIKNPLKSTTSTSTSIINLFKSPSKTSTSIQNGSNSGKKDKDKEKENSLINNKDCSIILSNIENYIFNQQKEKISWGFNKINSLQNLTFFSKLFSIKKDMTEILNHTSLPDYEPFLLRYIECTLNQINSKINKGGINLNSTYSSTEDNLKRDMNLSTLSDDGLIDYIYYKNNSVSFEIPLKRERAMSEQDKSKNLRSKFTKMKERVRMSSEEIAKRIEHKLQKAEINRDNLKLQYQENITKLMSRISDIKKKKKKERQENMQKLVDKLEKYNERHQQFLNQKTSKAKSVQDKVAEVNFLHRMEKQNKDLSIIKKLNISIERRESYIKQKLDKTLQRNLKEEAVEKKRKFNEEEIRSKIMKKIEKSENNKIDIVEEKIKLKIDDKIDLVNKRKLHMENQFVFLKNIYSENFIWELVQADYFDLDVLNNLTSITKFEILKAKLKKDRELIDSLFDKNNKSKISNKTKEGTVLSVSNIGSDYTNYDFTSNLTGLKDQNQADFNSDSSFTKENHSIKRSKSFTIFREDDFLEVDYLFKDSANKKKRKKKKKKPEVIKHKIIRSINSMSQSDLSIFFSKIKQDKKIKKYLIRSNTGKYIKSKIIVSNEDNSTSNCNTNKSNTNLLQIQIQKNSNQIDSVISLENTNSMLLSNAHASPVNNINTHTSIYSLSDNETLSDREFLSEDRDRDRETELSLSCKEKLIRNIVQNNSDVLTLNKQDVSSNSTNTILINSESLTNILEKNSILVKWCKLCNMILPNDQDTSIHVSKLEHKKLKNEYGISLQDDSSYIMVFQTLPGDISEDLKNERINAIKIRFKKVKQKLSLRAIKHENFWSYKQDFPSNNKQRLQKISFDIEKNSLPVIKDYESLENSIKDLIKILEQKKQNDLHIMRGLKVIHCFVEILRRPAVCHKSEIKNLGKIIELVVKVLMYFSTLIENRNYMVVTNRMSFIVDLLLWVLNKPSKLPLGISFLPDLIYLITIHVKHRIPFEYLSMKDDFIEYLFISNILIKFKQKFTSLVGPIDLTSGFGSFPLVLLKSLGMIEALTSQININYLSKPVYVKNSKISENILFVLEYTEIVGIVQLITTMLLSNGPVKEKSVVLPQTVVSATILGIKVLNNIARLDLSMFQNVCNNSLIQDQMYHMLNYIVNYSLEYSESSDDLKELLHETILTMNYSCLLNEKFQSIFSRGEVTLIQRICSLPFSYFCEKKLKDILFPTIISFSYKNDRNVQILNKEINLEMLTQFLREKIQLEPIIEEEEMDKLDESREEINFNLIKMSKGQMMSSNPGEILNSCMMNKRRMSFSSTASSTKSCHDMLTGVSDYIPLHHRFPRNAWEKALDFYLDFGK